MATRAHTVPPPVAAPPVAGPVAGAPLPASISALLAAVTPTTSGPSKTAIAGGLGVSGLAVYVVDRLLANDGQLAATMLTKLSPLLGPVWASWPVILILLGGVVWGAGKWAASQKSRAAADIAAAIAAADLSHKVGDVAAGLDGLRSEVHELRGALQDHAEHVDARLKDHDEGLQAVRAEVSTVSRRVDVLEGPVTAARRGATPTPRRSRGRG